MQIFENPDYKFVKHRWTGIAISVLFVLAGVVGYFINGINWGIDFAGGAAITLKFKETVPLNELRSTLREATIQQYGKPEERAVLIRLPEQKRETDYAGQVVALLNRRFNPESAGRHDLNFLGSDRLAALLKQNDPDNRGTNPDAVSYYNGIAAKIIDKRSQIGIFRSMNDVTSVPGVTSNAARVLNEKAFLGDFNVLNQETVGPQVGKELQSKALWAIVLSSLAMGVYIWLRFDFTFGIGAVVCIIHDVAIALAFMLIMRLEFSLNIVAALLTIVGYSINDTVVMYDRVRENKRKIKKPMSLGEHLDLAINQTLSRTILTSGSVFLVLVALLIFGGDVIRGFSWILMMGVISGTYSTLLIVPAVAVALDKRSAKAPASAVRADVPRVEPAARKRRAS
ncbi:MAG: protein translocase subunit SecF [Acidobacteriota bacterium]|nr:protein translocase subunit SecF [Acidobacteriota bacterium]